MLVKKIFTIVSYLPNPVAQIIASIVGLLLFYSNHKEKRVADTNIALCFPELTPAQQKELVKKSLIENAKTLFEIPTIFRKGGNYALDLITDVQGIELYKEALAKNTGVIVLAPHLGNWELVVHYLNQFSPMVAMYAPPKQRFLDDIMRKARESTGALLVPADATGVRALLKQLKKGGVIGILPDQQPKAGHSGTFAPFMGHDAYTMLLVNSLAKRVDATIIYAFAERMKLGKGYTVHFLKAPEGLDDANEITATTQLNKGVERCVRIAPSQYQWTYKRFHHQAPEKKSPYRDI